MEEKEICSDNAFYENGKAFWETIPATVDGMVCGNTHNRYSDISMIDIHASVRFMTELQQAEKNPVGNTKALDCGAGIGRVTKYFLSRAFDRVDLVEQNAAFLKEAKSYLGDEVLSRVDNMFCSALQDFTPKEGHYDTIWCQGVICHLTDSDFVASLLRAKKGLRLNGVIAIKENLCEEGTVFDEKDSSFTRSREKFLEIFERAGLSLISEQKQDKFPKEFYEVKMFALR